MVKTGNKTEKSKVAQPRREIRRSLSDKVTVQEVPQAATTQRGTRSSCDAQLLRRGV